MFKSNTVFLLFIIFVGEIYAKDYKRKVVGTIISYETSSNKASYDSSSNTYTGSFLATHCLNSRSSWIKCEFAKTLFKKMEKAYLNSKIAEEAFVSLKKKATSLKEEK